MSRTREQRAAIAKDAAARVERATGTAAALSYVWILWALEDADYATIPAYSETRMYAECAGIVAVVLLVFGLALWCWP